MSDNFCLDCGKLIDIRSKRCVSCSRKGNKHYNWNKNMIEMEI
jgi:hypothetical protein